MTILLLLLVLMVGQLADHEQGEPVDGEQGISQGGTRS